MSKTLSKREEQWIDFAEAVTDHLRDYTVPQYGDVGDDEITGYSVGDCVTHLTRYAKRYGTQSRKGQQELDFMKIAHYAQCAWEKYNTSMTQREINVPVEHGLLVSPTDKKYDFYSMGGEYELIKILIDDGSELHWFKLKEI